jgi:lipoprotein-releasing system ATP-binding protein
VEVLRGIDLAIEKGEALVIVGASGAGKSTLLHILGTLDRPTSGKVLLEGQDLFSLHEEALSRYRNRTMGFVFQFHHLLPMLTCLENTILPGLIAGRGKKELETTGTQLLEQVGLGARLGHRPAELSGGEQQRVAIARALMMQPSLLFTDEPTGNLDSRTGQEIADLLIQLRERHQMTLVVVTHNEALAARFVRRVQMQDGRCRPMD